MSNPVSNNPNASLAGGTTGVGVVVIYLLGLAGFNPTPEVAYTLGGGAASLLLFIGRDGLKGAFRVVWRGQSDQPSP